MSIGIYVEQLQALKTKLKTETAKATKDRKLTAKEIKLLADTQANIDIIESVIEGGLGDHNLDKRQAALRKNIEERYEAFKQLNTQIKELRQAIEKAHNDQDWYLYDQRDIKEAIMLFGKAKAEAQATQVLLKTYGSTNPRTPPGSIYEAMKSMLSKMQVQAKAIQQLGMGFPNKQNAAERLMGPWQKKVGTLLSAHKAEKDTAKQSANWNAMQTLIKEGDQLKQKLAKDKALDEKERAAVVATIDKYQEEMKTLGKGLEKQMENLKDGDTDIGNFVPSIKHGLLNLKINVNNLLGICHGFKDDWSGYINLLCSDYNTALGVLKTLQTNEKALDDKTSAGISTFTGLLTGTFFGLVSAGVANMLIKCNEQVVSIGDLLAKTSNDFLNEQTKKILNNAQTTALTYSTFQKKDFEFALAKDPWQLQATLNQKAEQLVTKVISKCDLLFGALDSLHDNFINKQQLEKHFKGNDAGLAAFVKAMNQQFYSLASAYKKLEIAVKTIKKSNAPGKSGAAVQKEFEKLLIFSWITTLRSKGSSQLDTWISDQSIALLKSKGIFNDLGLNPTVLDNDLAQAFSSVMEHVGAGKSMDMDIRKAVSQMVSKSESKLATYKTSDFWKKLLGL